MGSIGTTPGVGGLALQFVVDGLHETMGRYGVRIDNQHILATGALHTIVTALSRTAVLLVVIMQIKDACVFFANILACDF